MNTFSEPSDIRNPIGTRSFGRIRLLPILAGLIAALLILVVLSVVGNVIGASSYNPDGAAASVGIGAGVWGVLSALIAFAVGGWLAARISALHRPSNGILSGALVWTGALALILFLMISGLGADNPTRRSDVKIDTNPSVGVSAEAAAINEAGLPTTTPTTPQTVEPAAAPADHTLSAMLAWAAIGFVAAAFGGWLATRTRHNTAEVNAEFATHSVPGHD